MPSLVYLLAFGEHVQLSLFYVHKYDHYTVHTSRSQVNTIVYFRFTLHITIAALVKVTDREINVNIDVITAHCPNIYHIILHYEMTL